MEAGLTDIIISVNAINSFEYKELCRPIFKDAFENLCVFVGDCMNKGIQTSVSFVVGFSYGVVKTRSKSEYITFASSFGITPDGVIARDYMLPTAEEKSKGVRKNVV
jgi:wyosine [tRNA(Phe)-imidazoG37] synthetase (radical SAM superfamily)